MSSNIMFLICYLSLAAVKLHSAGLLVIPCFYKDAQLKILVTLEAHILFILDCNSTSLICLKELVNFRLGIGLAKEVVAGKKWWKHE